MKLELRAWPRPGPVGEALEIFGLESVPSFEELRFLGHMKIMQRDGTRGSGPGSPSFFHFVVFPYIFQMPQRVLNLGWILQGESL